MAQDTGHQKSYSRTVAAICVVVIIIAGAVLLIRGQSEAPTLEPETPVTSLFISPNKQDIDKGGELSLNVWANAGQGTVNTVEADLSYSTEYFDFVSLEDSNSSFPLAAQGQAKDGVITIVRGSTTLLKGNSLVAVVKLQAKQKAGKANIDFTKDSKLAGKTGKDVLQKTAGGTYTIK